MKKSSKRFILSDETVNILGFKVATSGIQLDDFKLNPVCLYNHEYDKLLGVWDDLQISGNQLTGIPVFDEADSEAMLYYSKVEQGILKGASIGITPLSFNDDCKTMEQCSVKEISLTPVPANKSAIAMYGLSGNKIADGDFRTFILSLNNSGGGLFNASTFDNRTYDDFALKAPKELVLMQQNDPARFNALVAKKVEAVRQMGYV